MLVPLSWASPGVYNVSFHFSTDDDNVTQYRQVEVYDPISGLRIVLLRNNRRVFVDAPWKNVTMNVFDTIDIGVEIDKGFDFLF